MSHTNALSDSDVDLSPGTDQSGWSKNGGSDLVVMNEEASVKHKTRETKTKGKTLKEL